MGADAAALRASGLEEQAQQCELLGEMQQSQRIADQTLASRQNYEQERARFAAYNEQGLLARMLSTP